MSTETAAPRSITRALLHRWLVEYNPVYLCSAALVLFGLTLIARALAQHDAVWSMLAVPALAELYAFSLIAGAAFLVRIGHRRPAVMLGLLAVLYQGDLTMNVELAVYLETVGKLAAASWVLLFALKLRAIAWALQLRLSRSAMVVPTGAALGLAALPHLLSHASPAARSALVAHAVFGIGAAAVWTKREVTSAVPWDVRGRRCLRAAWAIWAALAVGHVGYWAVSWRFDVTPIALLLPFLATRWMRREREVWGTVATALVGVAVLAPWHFWIAAVMAAVTLALHAMREQWVRVELSPVARAEPPYRSDHALHAEPPSYAWDVDPRATARLAIGAVVSAYLAIWTTRWTGGALPLHWLWLDVALVSVCLAVALHRRRRALITPLAPILLHTAAQRGWVTEPHGSLEWGIAATSAGFVSLLGAVWGTWRLGRTLRDEVEPAGTAREDAEPSVAS